MPPPPVPGLWIPACIYIFTCTLPDTPSKNAATSLRIRCFAKKCWTFAAEHAIISLVNAGIVHRLVYQPSKLRRWVRFPLPAPRIKHVDSLVISVLYLFLPPPFTSLLFFYETVRAIPQIMQYGSFLLYLIRLLLCKTKSPCLASPLAVLAKKHISKTGGLCYATIAPSRLHLEQPAALSGSLDL